MCNINGDRDVQHQWRFGVVSQMCNIKDTSKLYQVHINYTLCVRTNTPPLSASLREARSPQAEKRPLLGCPAAGRPYAQHARRSRFPIVPRARPRDRGGGRCPTAARGRRIFARTRRWLDDGADRRRWKARLAIPADTASEGISCILNELREIRTMGKHTGSMALVIGRLASLPTPLRGPDRQQGRREGRGGKNGIATPGS